MDSRLLGCLLAGTIAFSNSITLASMEARKSLEAAAGHHEDIGLQVVYGEDGRSEVFQVSDVVLREAASSTVAIFRSSLLTPVNGGAFDFKSKSVGETKKLCSDERFADQPAGAGCSGFLVGPDLIATAGHCIDESTCAEKTFVFGYQVHQNGSVQVRFPAQSVYRCKKVLSRGMGTKDHALVQLDRVVKGRKPLRMANRAPEPLDELAVIGHPMGLPTKVAQGGSIRNVNSDYFVASLDSYSGNSGSAVFDLHTLDVVGILVRGETDLVMDKERSCRKSLRCRQDSCRGEDVTQIRYVQQALQ